MMKEFVRSQNFTSTDEVMTAMKDMFKDILQEVMECELADELGYEKSERTSNDEGGKKSKNTNWKIIWQVRLSLAENLSVRFTPMNFWD